MEEKKIENKKTKPLHPLSGPKAQNPPFLSPLTPAPLSAQPSRPAAAQLPPSAAPSPPHILSGAPGPHGSALLPLFSHRQPGPTWRALLLFLLAPWTSRTPPGGKPTPSLPRLLAKLVSQYPI